MGCSRNRNTRRRSRSKCKSKSKSRSRSESNCKPKSKSKSKCKPRSRSVSKCKTKARSVSRCKRPRKVHCVDPLTSNSNGWTDDSGKLRWSTIFYWLGYLLVIAAVIALLALGLFRMRSEICGIPGLGSPRPDHPSDENDEAGNLDYFSGSSPQGQRQAPSPGIAEAVGKEGAKSPDEEVKSGWYSSLFGGNDKPVNDPDKYYGEGTGPGNPRKNDPNGDIRVTVASGSSTNDGKDGGVGQNNKFGSGGQTDNRGSTGQTDGRGSGDKPGGTCDSKTEKCSSNESDDGGGKGPNGSREGRAATSAGNRDSAGAADNGGNVGSTGKGGLGSSTGGAASNVQGTRGISRQNSVPAEENYSSCGSGAYIYRTNNFPPFRGPECDRGTHLILDNGPIDPERYWNFHPVGDVEIHLVDSIVVTGFTIQQDPNQDIKTIPKQIEFFGVEYDDEFRKKQTPLGQYTYTDYAQGQQKFLVQKPPEKRFEVVQLRFLNSQTGSESIHVYRVNVHGR